MLSERIEAMWSTGGIVMHFNIVRVLAAALAFLAAPLALGQVSHNLTDNTTSVTLMGVNGPGSTSGTVKVSADKASFTLQAGPVDFSFDVPSDFDKGMAEAVNLEAASFDFTFLTTDTFSGSATVSAGLNIKGLPQTILDALRGKCTTLKIHSPFVLRPADPSWQRILVPPQQTPLRNADGNCNIAVNPDFSIDLNFELAAFCHDEAKSPPIGGMPFMSIEAASPCIVSKFSEVMPAGSELPTPSWYGYFSDSFQDRIWYWNETCFSKNLDCDDVLAILSLHGDRTDDLEGPWEAMKTIPGVGPALSELLFATGAGQRTVVLVFPEDILFYYQINAQGEVVDEWTTFDLGAIASKFRQNCHERFERFELMGQSLGFTAQVFPSYSTEYGENAHDEVIRKIRSLNK